MCRAELNDMIAAYNHRCEEERRRAEPLAWGIAMAVMLGIAGAALFFHLACQ